MATQQRGPFDRILRTTSDGPEPPGSDRAAVYVAGTIVGLAILLATFVRQVRTSGDGTEPWSAAMALIAERADDIGARHVLTFVEQNNIASLKGCQRSGFFPDLLHRQVRLGFGVFRRDSFAKLTNDDPRRTKKF